MTMTVTIMSDCDCIPSVETLNFEDDVDGIWYYDFDAGYFTYNDSNGFYKLSHWSETYESVSWDYWYVQEYPWSNDDSWLMCCYDETDLEDCAGRWLADDQENGNGWYPLSTSTSIYDDCSVDDDSESDCNYTMITAADTDCRYLYGYFLSLSLFLWDSYRSLTSHNIFGCDWFDDIQSM